MSLQKLDIGRIKVSRPKVFSVVFINDSPCINYCRKKYGIEDGVLVIFILISFAGIISSLANFASGESMSNAFFPIIPSLPIFLIAGFTFTWRIYGTTRFTFFDNRLEVEDFLFFRLNFRTIFKCDIKCIRQIKTVGSKYESWDGKSLENSDAPFNVGWGLVVKEEKDSILISHDSIEVSYWMGQVVSFWSGKPFFETSIKE